tara:strand:- start:168 stop:434 length:267 start_codon:yes stop_codon:yes gene_type:complete
MSEKKLCNKKNLQELVKELLDIEIEGKKVFTPTVMINGDKPFISGLAASMPLYVNAKKDGDIRARDEDGKFVADDITTADNEAWKEEE